MLQRRCLGLFLKRDKYTYFAWYFLGLQVLVFLRNQALGEHIFFFYYCDNIALFLAIGFFLRNVPLIKGLISCGFMLQVIYLLDLISILVFDKEITGTTIYLFSYDLPMVVVTLLMHLGTTFPALVATAKEKNRTISLAYAFAYLVFLYSTTVLFTTEGYDMNCIFHACDVEWVYFPGFTRYWILLTFTFMVLPTHFFQELLQRILTRKSIFS